MKKIIFFVGIGIILLLLLLAAYSCNGDEPTDPVIEETTSVPEETTVEETTITEETTLPASGGIDN